MCIHRYRTYKETQRHRLIKKDKNAMGRRIMGDTGKVGRETGEDIIMFHFMNV